MARHAPSKADACVNATFKVAFPLFSAKLHGVNWAYPEAFLSITLISVTVDWACLGMEQTNPYMNINRSLPHVSYLLWVTHLCLPGYVLVVLMLAWIHQDVNSSRSAVQELGKAGLKADQLCSAVNLLQKVTDSVASLQPPSLVEKPPLSCGWKYPLWKNWPHVMKIILNYKLRIAFLFRTTRGPVCQPHGWLTRETEEWQGVWRPFFSFFNEGIV